MWRRLLCAFGLHDWYRHPDRRVGSQRLHTRCCNRCGKRSWR